MSNPNDVDSILPEDPISEQDAISGMTLTYNQIRILKNRRIQLVVEKAFMSLDSNVPSTYMQNEAYLRGKLDLLNELFDNHKAVTTPTQEV